LAPSSWRFQGRHKYRSMPRARPRLFLGVLWRQSLCRTPVPVEGLALWCSLHKAGRTKRSATWREIDASFVSLSHAENVERTFSLFHQEILFLHKFFGLNGWVDLELCELDLFVGLVIDSLDDSMWQRDAAHVFILGEADLELDVR